MKSQSEKLGKHSLGVWGYRIGLKKNEDEIEFDWYNLKADEDVIKYCKRDVELLALLFKYFVDRLKVTPRMVLYPKAQAKVLTEEWTWRESCALNYYNYKGVPTEVTRESRVKELKEKYGIHTNERPDK